MVCDSTRYLCQFACSKGKMGSFTSKSSDAFLKDEQDLVGMNVKRLSLYFSTKKPKQLRQKYSTKQTNL